MGKVWTSVTVRREHRIQLCKGFLPPSLVFPSFLPPAPLPLPLPPFLLVSLPHSKPSSATCQYSLALAS